MTWHLKRARRGLDISAPVGTLCSAIHSSLMPNRRGRSVERQLAEELPPAGGVTLAGAGDSLPSWCSQEVTCDAHNENFGIGRAH
jgi:hypothetical protein